jgi:UDP-N-acetylglucosamine/UDP-N-acetyl-alpha-D-glucosaminouronate 4-epimerase
VIEVKARAMPSYEQVYEALQQRPRSWLVTGAAGFIGSHLVETLLKLDQRVVGLDNLSTGTRSNLAQVKDAVSEGQWRNLRFIRGSIDSLDTCRQACRSVQYVLHEAALVSVPRSIADPIGTHQHNVTGFLNMLVAAHGAGVSRFVYASAGIPSDDHPAIPGADEVIVHRYSPYAMTKLVNELYAEMFARCYGFASIGLRYFDVFGPRQDCDGRDAAIVPEWITAMMRDEPAYIDGDGEWARDFCYIEDIVRANVLAAAVDDEAANNQIYNIAMGVGTTLNELFELIRSFLEPRFPHLSGRKPVHRAARRGESLHAPPDIGKAQRLLGFVPDWPVRHGLARTIAWYASRQAGSLVGADT